MEYENPLLCFLVIVVEENAVRHSGDRVRLNKPKNKVEDKYSEETHSDQSGKLFRVFHVGPYITDSLDKLKGVDQGTEY